MKRLERKWINQPSTSQPFHKLHGRRVIYNPNTEEVYFTEGDIISQKILPEVLSDGWPERRYLRTSDTTNLRLNDTTILNFKIFP